MNYFSFKISQANAINTVNDIKREEGYIEIEQLNQLEDSLIEGSLIFIMLGGDRVSWDKGLIGLAQIVRPPFDKGYDIHNQRNFKVGIKMLFSLENPIKRDEFIYYLDSYNAGGIGPATRGEQNQAIKSLTEKQAITIIRAMLDKESKILSKIENVFNEDFIAKIKGEIPVLVKYKQSYGNAPEEVSESEMNCTKQHIVGCNVLFYGVPGAGKSYIVDKEIGKADYERVVFHPDYTYSDFIGQIMPRLKKDGNGDEKLTYEFVPGPFTKALKHAVEKPEKMFYLVIEEINRGNAPAIFGDVFQLLDRKDDGSGKYYITNFDLAREIYGDENAKIRIPSNLSLLATMNTSDQNVFTLDTAFQRRWNMKYIRNNIMAAVHASAKIEGSDISWCSFANIVNEEVVEYNSEISGAEDKQLGAYFAKQTDLSSQMFPEKVLKYLWDDAFRLDREKLFNSEIKSVGEMIEKYQEEVQCGRDPIKRVMNIDIYNRMMDMSAGNTVEAFNDNEIFETEELEKE